MAIERKWLAVVAQPLTADGNAFGHVTVADTAGFKVKGFAVLAAIGMPLLQAQVQRVLSPTQMIVGPPGSSPLPTNFLDVSGYTLAKSATVAFPGEQDKNGIKPDQVVTAAYEGDPTVAHRVVLVDQYGQFYGNSNPIPIIFDGTVAVGEVEIKGSPSGFFLDVNADGSINVNVVDTPVIGQVERSFYNEITSVANGVQTQILMYTVPIATTALLHRIEVSGDNFARYDVYHNGNLYSTKRTWYGNFNEEFNYTTGASAALSLASGDVILVKVLHASPFLGTFEARLQLLEIS